MQRANILTQQSKGMEQRAGSRIIIPPSLSYHSFVSYPPLHPVQQTLRPVATFSELKALLDYEKLCQAFWEERWQMKLSSLQNMMRQPDQSSEQERKESHKIIFDQTVSKQDLLWQQKFKELVFFKEKNGHCNVPNNYAADISLGRWVRKQRYEMKKKVQGKPSNFPSYRVKALEKINFVYEIRGDKLWNQRYNDLVKFKKKYGHCNIPNPFPSAPKLRKWANLQRYLHKRRCQGENNVLRQDRIDALKKIGFRFAPYNNQVPWQQRYDELLEFKKTYGNCNVPREYAPNIQLGYWVCNQRKEFKNKFQGRTPEVARFRTEAFKKIGFLRSKENHSSEVSGII